MKYLLPLFGLLAVALPAQSFYYHPDNDPTQGGSNVIPFGNGSTANWGNQRAQFLFKRASLPGRPGLVRSVGFVPSSTTGTYMFKALVIRLGHNNTSTLGSSFSGNFSTPPQTVFNVYNMSWPVVASTWCRIPLARPFIYNGTDDVVVDVCAIGSDMSSGTSGFRSVSEPRAYAIGMTALADLIPFGTGCLGSNKKTPAADLLCMPLVGASIFDVGVVDAPTSAAALLLGGVSRTSFAGLPLPLDLGPLGAQGCHLLTSMEYIGGTLTDALGAGKVPLAIPYAPWFHGVSVYFQWLVPDATANTLGMITSNGLEAVLDLYEPAATSGASAGLKMEFEIL